MATRFEPGQILLVEFPFTDRTSAKMRPVVVVSSFKFNVGEDIVVVPISSRPDASDPTCFPILKSDGFFTATGLHFDSCAKWTKPTTISSRIVKRKLGVLSSEPLKQLQVLVTTLFT